MTGCFHFMFQSSPRNCRAVDVRKTTKFQQFQMSSNQAILIIKNLRLISLKQIMNSSLHMKILTKELISLSQIKREKRCKAPLWNDNSQLKFVYKCFHRFSTIDNFVFCNSLLETTCWLRDQNNSACFWDKTASGLPHK